MSKDNLTLPLRRASIPSYLLTGTDAVEVDESDLRWRKSSIAAITALLPSYGAFHSDTGMSLSRTVSEMARRKSMAHRRKSVAAIRDLVIGSESMSMEGSVRQLLRRMSVADQWIVAQDDHLQVVNSIKSMTASIEVKRKYR